MALGEDAFGALASELLLGELKQIIGGRMRVSALCR